MPTTTEQPLTEVSLAVGGMTCASCVSRVERKLNKIEGVQASVNLATERATVRYAAPVRPEQLVAAVEQAGYSAAVLDASGPAAADPALAEPPRLGRRALIAAALALPVNLL